MPVEAELPKAVETHFIVSHHLHSTTDPKSHTFHYLCYINTNVLLKGKRQNPEITCLLEGMENHEAATTPPLFPKGSFSNLRILPSLSSYLHT